MKTQTILLIAGAVGVGYLLSKKRSAEAVAAAAQAQLAATPRVAQITEPDDVIVQIPDVQYVPVWGSSWGSYRPRRGGWGGHHRGGHHGMHGFHGRRR